jgi:GTP-binding protein HflX
MLHAGKNYVILFFCDILEQGTGNCFMNKTIQQKERALIFGVIFKKDEDLDYQFAELKSLATTAGVEVVGQDFQLVRQITPATLIGSGKVEELKQTVEQQSIDVVIFDHQLSASQTRNLTNQLGVKVIDRITLILDIFAQRATTNEGKLQVALAQAKYVLPRLAQIQGTSGRFGSGGVGSRGPGETKLESDKRAIERNIQALEKQLKEIQRQREIKNQSRQKTHKTNVAIVGYTNAGKSTLLNLISKANIYADDKLFATLETTSRHVWLDVGKEIILTDTVGFISKLPHDLVHAFKSTLDEAKYADVILHVIDASNPHMEEQIEVVEQVLEELQIRAPIIKVYNKCDKIHIAPKMDEQSVCISAKLNRGIDQLKQMICNVIDQIKKQA